MNGDKAYKEKTNIARGKACEPCKFGCAVAGFGGMNAYFPAVS